MVDDDSYGSSSRTPEPESSDDDSDNASEEEIDDDQEEEEEEEEETPQRPSGGGMAGAMSKILVNASRSKERDVVLSKTKTKEQRAMKEEEKVRNELNEVSSCSE